MRREATQQPAILDTGEHMRVVANFQRCSQARETVDELSVLLSDAKAELASAEGERLALERGFGRPRAVERGA